jgi:UDPglucose--hexose-1-phosphate uridylyltransferase
MVWEEHWHPLRREWVVVAAHRQDRPWNTEQVAHTHASIDGLSETELGQLAEVLEALLVRFDNLWRMPFPYVMALHQAPTDGGDYACHHFHIQLHPPLRKPNLLKYLAGPEVGAGGFISDTAPEDEAAELLAVPAVHYGRAAAAGSP